MPMHRKIFVAFLRVMEKKSGSLDQFGIVIIITFLQKHSRMTTQFLVAITQTVSNDRKDDNLTYKINPREIANTEDVKQYSPHNE